MDRQITKPSLSQSARAKISKSGESAISARSPRKRARRSPDKSDVLISAVISTYLLTHLHHVLQRAEYRAAKDGRESQAANFAQLRKVLCMDARSMSDAFATGVRDRSLEKFKQPQIESNAA